VWDVLLEVGLELIENLLQQGGKLGVTLLELLELLEVDFHLRTG
jgi:hypothetical protein